MKTPMSLNSVTTDKNRKRIDRLFLKFTAFYGQLWRSQLKCEDFMGFMKNEWCEALAHVEDKNLDKAIQHCLNKKEFPPTLPHFIDLCKEEKKSIFFQKNQQEERNKSKPEVALKYLTQIKKKLQMNTK
jgi:hypothetical protein